MSRVLALTAIAAAAALAVVAVRSRSFVQYQTPEFSASELQLYMLSDGSVQFDPSVKPAVNSLDDSFFQWDSFGLAGLSNVSEFDWGAWATETEPWGDQTVILPVDYPPIPQDEIELMNVDQLIFEVADHLKAEEGFRDHVYDDVNGKPWTQSKRGNPTIGYGHVVTADDVAQHGWGWRMNEEEAYLLLLGDVNAHLSPIVPHVTVPLTLNQWIAITSLAFNAGPHKVKNSSFIKAVNRLDWSEAERQFKDWDKATVVVDGQKIKKRVRGLTLRREREWALFATPNQVVMLEGVSQA